jgi:hypothetical protein
MSENRKDKEDYSKYDKIPLSSDRTPPFRIISPQEQLREYVGSIGLQRAVKEANFYYRDRYVVRNKQYNSLIDLSEGSVLRTSILRGFIPGKVYTYNYDPKHKVDLDYYDIRPLMLSLGHVMLKNGDGNRLMEIGINLHFLPPDAIQKIMELTWKVFQYKLEANFENLMKENYGNQVPLPIYQNAKKIYDLIGKTNYKFAIRCYLPNRMKDVQIVEYTDWKYIPLLETKWIIGITKAELYSKYAQNYVDRKAKDAEKEARKQERLNNAQIAKNNVSNSAKKRNL